jgi:hypothetical protein
MLSIGALANADRERAMRNSTVFLLAGAICSAAATLPARADVFSMQGFSGETTTMEALPGVNLEAVPGQSLTGNCVERPAVAFSARDRFSGTRVTECRVGNFTFSTSGENPYAKGYDTTYGGNPPPWEQGWRP